MAQFRFTVGPWNVHEGADAFGPEVRPSIPLEEKFRKFKEIGLDGVQFHDDDAVPNLNNMTEGEIIDAIRRTPGARSLDGVKRRTRAGMGRCQAGFCSPRVMEILARELGVPQSEITKSGGASKIIVGTNKDSL